MQLNSYNNIYSKIFIEDQTIAGQINESLDLLKDVKRIFFIGNGGSNSICSHMMEDFFKIGRFPTFAFSDAALITCFANDYGYDKAMAEWLKLHFQSTDLLVAVSSSGKSPNILNAVEIAKIANGKIITLTGFESENPLRALGDINFYLPVTNYGIVECFHQVILHALLDEYAAQNSAQ
jgi:D-sedoheptulose 7-phosphate isomerase